MKRHITNTLSNYGKSSGYAAIHAWVRRYYGKAYRCEWCEEPSSRFEWANVSGDYWRDIDDWLQLCTSCHRRFDYTNTPERNAKRSKTLSGKVYPRMEQPVDQYTLDGVFIARHSSMKKASLAVGLSISGVSGVVNGYRPTAGGYKWTRAN